MNLDTAKLLVDTAQQLSTVRNLEGIMDIVRMAARKLTGADGVTFILKENDQCFYADEDAIGPLWKGRRFPLTACVSGWSMINKVPAVIEDIYADSRVPTDAYKPTFVKSLAMVPIRKSEPIGAIGNYWATQHRATEEQIFLLQSLADIISVSIENVYLYTEMEQRVKDRTKQLEEANKTLQTFNYSVSHDLQAPLRAFRGYTDMLAKKYGEHMDAGAKTLVEKLAAISANMDELLNGLLDFSKVDGTQVVYKKVPVPRIVNDICENVKEQESGKYISFNIKELPVAAGDPLLIKQVWTNLISNAVKYSSAKAEPKIDIGAKFLNNEIVYYVKDNGEGFDMKYSGKLFGIFQRLHSKEEFPGNGVGLAICEKIISKHGGRVWAEGRPGEGAVFYFSLPVKQPEILYAES